MTAQSPQLTHGFFNSQWLLDFQKQCVFITSIFGILWVLLTYRVAFQNFLAPWFGPLFGLLIGALSFHINYKYNSIIIDPDSVRREAVKSKQPGNPDTRDKLHHKIFDIFCVFGNAARIAIGSYTGYLIIGERLGWPWPQMVFAHMGMTFAVIGAAGAFLYLTISLNRKWTLEDSSDTVERPGFVWETLAIIMRSLQHVDDYALMALAYYIEIGTTAGLTLGIVMASACFIISLIANYQVYIRDKVTKDSPLSGKGVDDVEYQNTFWTNVLAGTSMVCTMLSATSSYVLVYTGYMALGATVPFVSITVFAYLGVSMGALTMISQFIKYASTSERLWNENRLVDVGSAMTSRPVTSTRGEQQSSSGFVSCLKFLARRPSAANDDSAQPDADVPRVGKSMGSSPAAVASMGALRRPAKSSGAVLLDDESRQQRRSLCF